MDLNIIDVTVLENNGKKLEEAQKAFFDNCYSLFKNSYVHKCSDSRVHQMSKYLDEKYKILEQGYQKIIKWCNEYLNEVKGVEFKLAQMGGSTFGESELASFGQKFSSLESYDTSLSLLLNPSLIKSVTGIESGILNFSSPTFSQDNTHLSGGSHGLRQSQYQATLQKEYNSGFSKLFKKSGGIVGNFSSKIASFFKDGVFSNTKNSDFSLELGENSIISSGFASIGAISLMSLFSEKKKDTDSESFLSFGNSFSSFSSNSNSFLTNDKNASMSISHGSFTSKGQDNTTDSSKTNSSVKTDSSVSQNTGSFSVFHSPLSNLSYGFDKITEVLSSHFSKTNSHESGKNVFSFATPISNVQAVLKGAESKINSMFSDTSSKSIGKSVFDFSESFVPGGPLKVFHKSIGAFVFSDTDSLQAQLQDKLSFSSNNMVHNVSNSIGNVVENIEKTSHSFFENLKGNTDNKFLGNVIDGVESLTGAIVSDKKSEISTKFNIASSAWRGVLDFVEGITDTYSIGKGISETPYTLISDMANMAKGKEVSNFSVTNGLWNKIKNLVSVKAVDEVYDSFYDNKLGKIIDDSSYITSDSTASKVISGVTKTLSVIATSLFGGAVVGGGGTLVAEGGSVLSSSMATISSSIAAVGGVSQGAEDAWNDGASVTGGLGYGIFNGAWEGLQFYIGSKINLLGKGSGQFTNGFSKIWDAGVGSAGKDTALRIFLDGIDGAVEGFVQPLMKKVYKNESYKDLFQENGGWGYVLTNGITGATVSFLTEIPDIMKIFNSKELVNPSYSSPSVTKFSDEEINQMIVHFNELYNNAEDRLKDLFEASNYQEVQVPKELSSQFNELVSLRNNINGDIKKYFSPFEDEINFRVPETFEEAKIRYETLLNSDNQLKGIMDDYLNGKKTYVPEGLEYSFHILNLLRSKMDELGSNVKEEVSKVSNLEIDPIFKRYNELLDSDSRLAELLKKASNGEVVNVPKELSDAFSELRILSSQLDGKSVLENIETALKNLDDKMDLSSSFKNSQATVSENASELIDNQITESSSLTDKVKSFFSNVFSQYNGLKKKLNIDHDVTSIYQLPDFKTNFKNELGLEILVKKYNTLLGTDDRLENLLKESLNDEIVVVPKELESSFKELTSLYRQIEEIDGTVFAAKNTEVSNLEKAFDDFKIPDTLEEVKASYEKLLSSDNRLTQIMENYYGDKSTYVPDELVSPFHILISLRSKMDELGSNVKEEVSKVSNLEIDTIFKRYNELLDSDSRLAELLKKASNGEVVNVPKELSDAFSELRILSSQLDGKSVLENIETSLKNFDNKTDFTDSFKNSQATVSENPSELIDNQITESGSLTDKVKSFFSNVFSQYNEFKKKLNIDHDVTSIYQLPDFKTNFKNELGLEILVKKYNTLLGTDDRLENLLKESLNDEIVVVPKELESSFKELTSLYRQIEEIDGTVFAAKNTEVPNLEIDTIFKRYNELLDSDSRLAELLKKASNGEVVNVPKELSDAFSELRILSSQLDGKSVLENIETSLKNFDNKIESDTVDSLKNSSKMNLFSSFIEKLKKGFGIHFTSSKVVDNYGIVDTNISEKLVGESVLDKSINLQDVVSSFHKPNTIEEALSYYDNLLASDSRLKVLMDQAQNNKNVEIPSDLYADFITLNLLKSHLDEQLSLKVPAVPVQRKTVKELTQEYNAILSSDSRLKKYIYLLRRGDDFTVPLNLQNQYNELVRIASEIEKIHPKGNIGTSILLNQPELIVISDLHGKMDRFESVLQQLDLNPNSRIIVAGDAMDRGGQGVAILLQIKELCEQGKMKYIPGNHDMAAYNYLKDLELGSKHVKVSEALLKAYGGADTISDIKYFNNLVNHLYANGTIHKKISLKELTAWLGSQPIQYVTEENGTKYVIAHAIFDQSLYKYNKNFNLDDGYRLFRTNQDSMLFKKFLNIMQYRINQSNYISAPVDLPQGYVLVVGHTPQPNVNMHFVDDKTSAVYVDTGNASSFRGFSLSTGKEVDFATILQEFNERLSFANSINAHIASNVHSVMDSVVKPVTQIVNTPVEILKENEPIFYQGLKKLDETVGIKSNSKYYQFFRDTMENNYRYLNDKTVEKILNNLYKLDEFSIVESKYGMNVGSKRLLQFTPELVSSGNESIVNHEFGHLLHDSVMGGKLPVNYVKIVKNSQKYVEAVSAKDFVDYVNSLNSECSSIQSLISKSMTPFLKADIESSAISQFASFSQDDYIDYVRKNNIEVNLTDPSSLFQALEHRKDRAYDNFVQGITNNQNSAISLSQDILGSIFQKRNISLKNGQKIYLSVAHTDEYYSDISSCFSEQIANYIALKFGNATSDIQKLRQILGEEWYQMMENYVSEIAKKLEVRR